MEGEIRNARIKHATLSMADHGCLTYGLALDGGGVGVVYGGICLGHGYLGAKEFKGHSKSIEAMMRIMDVVGVERWEDLTGKYVRFVDPGWGGTVDTIGNIIEDKWFNQREFFQNGMEEEKGI